MKLIRISNKEKNSSEVIDTNGATAITETDFSPDGVHATNESYINTTVMTDAAGIAARYISSGKVLILPTSTIYGLSCSYNNKNALEKIYEIKQRPGNLPFIVLISRIDPLLQLVSEIGGIADTLIKKYWTDKNSQPLTLIFKKNNSVDNFITGDSKKIAIRLEGLEILQKIIELSGPIVSTSATISGMSLSPKNINEIPEIIKENADLIIDLCLDLPGTASTIIDVSESEPVLIREGALKYDKVLYELF